MFAVKMQAVAEPKAVKEITPGMKRINEMFQGKTAAKPKATGPVEAGLSTGSSASVGGAGSVKRKVDAANIEVNPPLPPPPPCIAGAISYSPSPSCDSLRLPIGAQVDDLLCGLDKDLAGASTVKKKKILPASRPAQRQAGALFPPSGRAPSGKRRVPVTPDSLLTKAGVS